MDITEFYGEAMAELDLKKEEKANAEEEETQEEIEREKPKPQGKDTPAVKPNVRRYRR